MVMCPVPSAVHQDPIFCDCQARFGGHLPVPRAEAALPYWVPLTLRPQKQIEKTVRVYIPEATKACPCSRHRFGGRLPMPRDQATMPYWVPRVLRFHKKVRRRLSEQRGLPGLIHFLHLENPLDSRSWYNRWRICCDGHLLLKWQQLQALHRDGPLALERGANPQVPLLPLNLSFLTFLQAVLRIIVVIRYLIPARLMEEQCRYIRAIGGEWGILGPPKYILFPASSSKIALPLKDHWFLSCQG
ncbi:uncharacterized protein C16orf95 homolog [Pteropus vampyrus]|uniref:Uncharacterized protein C16orf95 homolog n=1 Tax=Pteropus vampyrus TaxID=132908 RepID=A0A6P6CZY1_PTEVA|nr:uncharacterized protein C16orf95 homolog [Pteropus vampyrus]